MFSGPFQDMWHHIVSLWPGFLSKSPHFNFITVHYFWIIALAIVGSILLYPAGNLEYIDALFFASGACTQAGLNTVDVNLLNTYQQLVLYFLPMLTNPISINTFVVFLRLYWFEKRFQHIAKEARRRRGTLSKSRSQMRGERDIGNEEKGINGREIVVMHNTTGENGQTDSTAPEELDISDKLKTETPGQEAKGSSSDTSNERIIDESAIIDDLEHDSGTTAHPTQIKFADRVKRSDGMSDETLQIAPYSTEQDHIAVLERQRNPQDKGVLRIPGPRDAERGIAPESLEEEEAERQRHSRRDSIADKPRRSSPDIAPEATTVSHRNTTDQQKSKRDITRNEPDKIVHQTADEKARAAAHTLSIFRLRTPRVLTGTKMHEERNRARPRANSFVSFMLTPSRDKNDMTPYLSWQPTVGRNSAFVDLSEAQREELGGIEYRSLKSLALILVLYFWGFMILGVIGLLPWIIQQDTWGSIIDSDGINRTWWAFFTANTSFNDVGFTLTPDSMISFQTAIWPLLLLTFLVIIGNTGFPIMLRWIIWITSLYVPTGSGYWEELQFLLDHPRRCFTLLFPSKATWWLFWILVIFNGLDLLFFIVLDLGNTIVTQLPVNIRILDGWFQAVSTRTAGLACVNLSSLHPAIQVSYMIMMYISVLPIAISVRRTNVYEEQSLGLYGKQGENDEQSGEPSYVGTHLRRQLSFDLWYIFLGFFIVAISEGPKLQSGDTNFTMFNVLFEIVSAYGTVGLSLGYPTINASFSAEFGVVAKLVIIAMQIRGRHRGLPYELDRAILLPSESMHENEDHDAAARIRRRGSAVTTSGVATGSDLHRTGATDGSTDRGASRKRKAPNFLSKLMHPGPTAPREVHLAEKSARIRREALMSPANNSDPRAVGGEVPPV